MDFFKSIPLHMDFDGQYRAERLSRIIITLFGIVGLIWGYVIQQFSQTVYILAAGFLLASLVFADYCEFGTCDENTEYCCGENKCCKKTVDVWYYWAAVLLVVITIIVAACFYMRRIKSKYTPYSKLEQQFDEVTTNT